ncbi:MAG: imidazolonepropionase [Gammaproteobacteria bacterium]|nr:MAG: imidazolonepropionase [Gammaproteobacteria bacterium]
MNNYKLIHKLIVKLTTSLILSLLAINVIAKDYLIKNATVHTASEVGVLNSTDVLISDGFIMELGKNLSGNSNVEVIDAKGQHLTPGLINANTQMGLVEISAASSTVDHTTEQEGVGASFNIAPAINFRSTLIPQNRINGLTRAIVVPGFGNSIFAGSSSAIALLSDMTGMISENIAQHVLYGVSGAEFNGGSRAAAHMALDKALEDANYLRHNRRRFEPGFESHFSLSIADLDALKPVLERKIPLIINVHRSDSIIRMIALAKKHNIKIVLQGASEAWVVSNEIARANVPVIIDPISNLPNSFSSLSSRIDAASILHNAGVKMVFTGMQSTHNGYLVRQSAGNAVSHGLPAEEALKAMTINTAEVFGIKNYGQIKVGMEADVVIWDGDPMEVTTNAEQVFIKGQKQPMVSRATRLRDRFWDLNDNKNKAYVK